MRIEILPVVTIVRSDCFWHKSNFLIKNLFSLKIQKILIGAIFQWDCFYFFFLIIIFFTSVLFEYIKVTVNNYSMFCDLLPRIHCNIFAVSFSQNSAACINGLIWNWESLSDALRSTEQCENFLHFKSDSARGFGERSFIAWKLRASRYIQVSFYSQRDLICIQSTFQSNGWLSNLLIRH